VASSSTEASAKPRPGRGRTIAVTLLLIVACVLAPLSLIAVWTRNTLLDTDQYVETVGPLAHNPKVINAIASNISEEVVQGTNVEAKVKDALPPRADFIAPAVARSLGTVVHDVAVRILSSDQFETLWKAANRRAHDQVEAVLTGGGSKITTKNGEVAVNLGPVVDKVQKALAGIGINVFSDSSARRVSPRFVLIQSDELKSAQSAVDLLQKLSIVLPIVMLLFFAAAIAISRNRRMTVLHAGLGFAAAMLVVLTAFNLGRTAYLDALKAAHPDAAAAVYDQLLSFLRLSARSLFALGLVVAIGAWLAGPSTAAVRVRSFVRGGEGTQLATEGFPGWIARSRTGLRIVFVAIGALILVTWSHPRPLTVLIITIVVLIAIALTEFFARTAADAAPSTPASS
jgi:hypothetical protein